jgi:hypothetical protein
LLLRKADFSSPSVQKKVKVYLGAQDLTQSKGVEFRGAELHIHPKRIELEKVTPFGY